MKNNRKNKFQNWSICNRDLELECKSTRPRFLGSISKRKEGLNMWDIVKVSNASNNKQTNKKSWSRRNGEKEWDRKSLRRGDGVFLWLMEDIHQERRSRTKATTVTLIKTRESDTEET